MKKLIKSILMGSDKELIKTVVLPTGVICEQYKDGTINVK